MCIQAFALWKTWEKQIAKLCVVLFGRYRVQNVSSVFDLEKRNPMILVVEVKLTSTAN